MSALQPDLIFKWPHFTRHKLFRIITDMLFIIFSGSTIFLSFRHANWFLFSFNVILCFLFCRMVAFKIRTFNENLEVHFILSNKSLEYWIQSSSYIPAKPSGWLSNQLEKLGLFITLNKKVTIEKEAIKNIQFSRGRDQIIIHLKTGKKTIIDLNNLEALDKRELLLDEISRWYNVRSRS